MLEEGQELLLESGKKSAKTFLRGWKQSQYLLVDMPGGSWPFSDGTNLICRTQSEGTYYGFNVQCIGPLSYLKLMALSFPEEIVDDVSLNGRKWYEATLPVSIHWKEYSGERDICGVITKINTEGCTVSTMNGIDADEKVVVSFSLPTGKKADSMACWLKSGGSEDGRYVYVLQFDPVEREKIGFIKDYLEAINDFI